MSKLLRNVLFGAGILVAGQAAAQVTLYENDGFRGQSFTADRPVWNLERWGFNDRASSVVVRGGSWEVCSDARFEGRCVVLRPGDYPSLRALGLSDQISSLREVNHYGRDDRGNNPYARDDRDFNVYGRDDDRMNQQQRGYRDDNRYEYRNDGWRFDRNENRWERY
ncbi:MAG: beta/gamma crystallin family protein [Pseudomonadota bacterium]|nr:beta/gamma crystallin family protein [Pseudomonadota bacterium]